MSTETTTLTLTCITCRRLFTTALEQRQHYKSDFHRFNIKRKVVGLPIVSEEVFSQKLTELKQEAIQTKPPTNEEQQYCNVCQKKFSTQKTFNQHLTSNKHKASLAKSKSEEAQQPQQQQSDAKQETRVKEPRPVPPKPEKEMTEEEWVDWKLKIAKPIIISDCLFCKHQSPDLVTNLEHMTLVHSFYIPEFEYVSDVEGLIKFLGEKITVGNMCIYCNNRGKTFYSVEAAREHMRELVHCKMCYEKDEAEYQDYYDFSASYDEGELDGQGKPILKQHFDIADNGLELVLKKDGEDRVLGHRSLAFFYKQRVSDKRIVTRSLATEYKRLQEIERHKSTRVDTKILRREQTDKTRLGIKANKLQTFYRHQNPL